MNQEYTQPTAAPVPKVAAVGVSGLVVTIVVLIAGAFGITLPADMQDNITQLIAGVTALTTLVNFVVAYYKKDRKPAAAVNIIQNEGKK